MAWKRSLLASRNSLNSVLKITVIQKTITNPIITTEKSIFLLKMIGSKNAAKSDDKE